MQRPGNVGGHGGGIWPEGVPNYNLNPGGHVPMQPLHLNRLGQNPGNSGQKLWTMESANSGTDRASLLGTKQWGRESGGAPWGQTSPTEKAPVSNPSLPMSSSASLLAGTFSSSESSVRSPLAFNIADYVLGGGVQDASALIGQAGFSSAITQESRNNNIVQPGQISGQILMMATEQNSASVERASRDNSPTQEELKSHRHSQNQQQLQMGGRLSPRSMLAQAQQGSTSATTSSTEQPVKSNAQSAGDQPSQSQVSEPADSGAIGGTNLPASSASEAPQYDEQQQISVFPGAADIEFGDGQTSSQPLDSALQQQMSQLNLDYNAHQHYQQSLVHQLAVQQQYLLAQQQQLAAMPGVFLPNPYMIASPNAAAGYPDPATAGQFSMMSQYPPYATWPSVAYHPSMMSPHMAAMASQQYVTSLDSNNQSGRNSQQTDNQLAQRTGSPATPQIAIESVDPPISLPPPVHPDMLANATLAGQGLNPAMAMSGSAYQMIPTAYYDQTGALIVNNGRYGGPMRLFASGVPQPMFMNGSPHNQSPGATISGGSTPVPGPAHVPGPAYTPVGPHGNLGAFAAGLGSLSSLGSAMASQSSTPQRRDSFSDYGKHPSYGGPMSQFYNSFGMSPAGSGMGFGAVSPSPGLLSGMAGSALSPHSMSPPPLSSPSGFFGGGNRMFSAAPGAEARFRNGSMLSSSIFGSSGSSLFPPTNIRPMAARDVPMAGRSRLLDDFRNNRFPNPQLRDLVNHVVEFSRDQHGSRFIQQKLERATPQEKQLVFSEIARAAYQLMTDVFGNYVIQKFFEFGSQEQKLALAKCIQGHVLPLALQMYGCRVIQKALECIPTEEQVEIIKELDGHLIQCVKDQNGNHVVQKCIECVASTHLQFIIHAFQGNVVALSMHPYGCRVMQRILEHCTPEQTAPILEELHQQADTLIADQYGNYVIQHILEHGRPENRSQIVLGLTGKVMNLSQHKFASNVVEKCVSHASRVERAILIEEACQDSDALLMMMKDQYANYVIQKMLDVAEPAQKNTLISKIRPHMAQLRKFTYGKHIIAKLEKYLMKTSTSPTGSISTTMSQNMGTPSVVLPRDMPPSQ